MATAKLRQGRVIPDILVIHRCGNPQVRSTSERTQNIRLHDRDLARRVTSHLRWARRDDAQQLEVAEEEAGMAVRRPEMFDRVVQAVHMLDLERDTEHTPPTK